VARPVIVRYEKGPRAGAEYELASAAVAKKAHPDAKIVMFGDSLEPYSEDAPRTEEAARKAAAAPPEKVAEP